MTHQKNHGRPPEGEALLTAFEVAGWIGVDHRTLRKWSVSNRFPEPLRCGLRWVRWRREDVESWLAGTWKPPEESK